MLLQHLLSLLLFVGLGTITVIVLIDILPGVWKTLGDTFGWRRRCLCTGDCAAAQTRVRVNKKQSRREEEKEEEETKNEEEGGKRERERAADNDDDDEKMVRLLAAVLSFADTRKVEDWLEKQQKIVVGAEGAVALRDADEEDEKAQKS